MGNLIPTVHSLNKWFKSVTAKLYIRLINGKLVFLQMTDEDTYEVEEKCMWTYEHSLTVQELTGQ